MARTEAASISARFPFTITRRNRTARIRESAQKTVRGRRAARRASASRIAALAGLGLVGNQNDVVVRRGALQMGNQFALDRFRYRFDVDEIDPRKILFADRK